MEDKRFRAYLRLHLAEGVGAILFRRLMEAFGDVESVSTATPARRRRIKGVGEKTAAAIEAVTEQRVDEELAEADKRGVKILCFEDESYPVALKAIHDPPPVLYVRGRLEPADAVATAIVGSRRCTHYGLEQADRFGQLLGRAGFTVVSGGLTAGGRTIAVMGCGLSETYPRENARLFEQIVVDGRGALVSELPMRTAVLSGNFPTRNRIVSGLSLGVLVVEAARRSGALITAHEAAEQGREVFVIPGRVDSPLSQGANELIRSGATLVQNLEDVLQQLGEVGAKMSPQESADEEAIPAGLSETERKLLTELKDQPLSLDELVRRSGCETGKVASALTMLVLKGAAVQQPGNVFARKGRREKTG